MSSGVKTIGVGELRQNLSAYLQRAKRGQTYEIAERGHLVALLTPAPEISTALRRLISARRASATAGDLLALGPPPKKAAKEAIE